MRRVAQGVHGVLRRVMRVLTVRPRSHSCAAYTIGPSHAFWVLARGRSRGRRFHLTIISFRELLAGRGRAMASDILRWGNRHADHRHVPCTIDAICDEIATSCEMHTHTRSGSYGAHDARADIGS